MKLTLCWTNISGYMAACWRALAAKPEVDLRVIAFKPKASTFDPQLMEGLDCRLLDTSEAQDAQLIAQLVKEGEPDVVYTTGWLHAPYRRLVTDPDLALAQKWMGVDTPWRGTWRQQAGRLVLRRFVHRFDRVFVAGERAWQYMRMLGVPEQRLRRGLYGHDGQAFAAARTSFAAETWPRKFLFTGRYVDVKGIDVLLDGYQRYRQEVGDPWELTCCGSGPLGEQIRGRVGVTDLGFVQPAHLPKVMAQHGAFVLTSRYEPWGVVIAEAGSSGLPVLCTESCGAAVELVRSYFNGMTIPTGDAGALAMAMRWVHEHVELLPEMGRRSQELAQAYSAQIWAVRWAEAFRDRIAESGVQLQSRGHPPPREDAPATADS